MSAKHEIEVSVECVFSQLVGHCCLMCMADIWCYGGEEETAESAGEECSVRHAEDTTVGERK